MLLPETRARRRARAGRAHARGDRPPAGHRGRDRRDVSATVSIGIAMCPRDGTDTSPLIHRADLAVYRAKIQGRNRVVDGARRAARRARCRTRSGGARSRVAPSSPATASPSPHGSASRRTRRSRRRPSLDSRLRPSRDIALQASLAGIAADRARRRRHATSQPPPTSSHCSRSPRSSPAGRRSRSRPRRARSRSALSARSRAPR